MTCVCNRSGGADRSENAHRNFGRIETARIAAVSGKNESSVPGVRKRQFEQVLVEVRGGYIAQDVAILNGARLFGCRRNGSGSGCERLDR